ncbi:allantoate deiminase [Amphibacillus marinus]|uniref:Allantoate deiminase n=1 Tax=Amphibacillus marinus TaxID=872970 RepID=A0A1H8PMG9_9BACI|nr:Zn-dependent hydrolase [Amphibacillus marinus]SEO42908.1 allantoate deiminase [Amphibacillus marinus]
MIINCERLWKMIQQLGEIGRTEQGGLTRLAFSKEEQEAKQLLRTYLEAAHLTVYEDAMGNFFGRYPAEAAEAETLLIGSHIDTVFNGGKFDGAAGVLIGIEVLRTLAEQNVTLPFHVEVVAFTDEEGARFSSGMLGSQAFIGQLTQTDLEKYSDQAGIPLVDAMINQGYQPIQLAKAKRDPEKLKGYLEVHIEQGKVLEEANAPVGLVTGIVGLRWLKINLKGEAGHAGTTPMHLRKDPLACAAELITFIEALIKRENQAVATVGQLSVKPGGINVIPAEVEFTVDLRDLSDQKLDRLVTEIEKKAERIAEKRGIATELNVIEISKAVHTTTTVTELMETVMNEQQLPCIKLPSGAGHDAMILAQVTPIGMIFVRTKEGISHHPAEFATADDLAIAAQVLYDTIIKMACY